DMDVYADQIYVVGHISGNVPGGFDGILKAYDTRTGAFLWQEQYDLNGSLDFNYGVTAQAGFVYVCGDSVNASGYQDWIVRALDARDGSLVWQDQFDLADFSDHAWTVAVDGHRLFVAGFAMTAAGNFDYSAMVRAYHAGNGSLLWQYQFDVPGSEDEAYYLAVGGNSVFVGGRVENIPPYDADWLLLALNAEDGSLLWQEQFGLVGGSDSLSGIAFIRNQLIAFGKATNSSGEREGLIRAYDARNGAFMWQNQIELDGNSVGISSIAAERHQVFVAGSGTNAAGNRDWVVQALHARDGELLWQDQF
ncbi:MAG: PQQ-binding-like beta-propeller repeat protein, partial [Ketobacter sp.]|nr:PQQ-binding-like beta-propeller repeat protein [Ketobacter sp.]